MTHPSEEELAALLFDALPQQAGAPVAAHVAECPECAQRIEALRGTLRALEHIPVPAALSSAHVERLRRGVHDEIAPVLDLVTGGLIAVATAVAFATLSDAADALRWTLALAAAGGAALLATFAPRSPGDAYRALSLSLVGSLSLAAFDLLAHGVFSGPVLGEHRGCEWVVAAVAVSPLLSAAYFARRSGTSPQRRALHGAIGGAAGGLAGQAALLTTCSSPEGFLHVFFFHVVAVLAMTLAGAIVGRAMPIPARA